MTRNELMTSVANKLNSTVALLGSASVLLELNNAQRSLFRAVVDVNEDFFEEQKTKFNLIANSSLYSLPTDLVKFKQLRLAYATPTSESDYKVATSYDPAEVGVVSSDEENMPVSTPIVDITNNYMRIRPVPSVSVTNGGQIYYIARPSALTNSADVSVIPVDYHDLMAVCAAWKMAEHRQTYDTANYYRNQFKYDIEEMKRQLAVREINRDFRFRDMREVNRSNRQELPN